MARLVLLGVMIATSLTGATAALLGSRTPHDMSTHAPQIQTVGASVMLRCQREGAPVYDFRTRGQVIPGAQRVGFNSKIKPARETVLIGDGARVIRIANHITTHNTNARVYLVPSHAADAYPDFAGVRQIAPRKAWALMQKPSVRVFDFAEAEEFEFARVTKSTRIAWTRVLRDDFSTLEKCGAKTILLICPVGSRSQIACRKLKERGIGVLNIRGGMFAWQNCGLPVEGGSTHVR